MSPLAKLLQEAVQRHQAGDLGKAELLYREVLQQQPQQADALHLLGVIRDQQGSHAEAVDLISRAIRAAPHAAAFHGNLGTALLSLGRVEDAAAAYREAIRLDGSDAESHYNLGNVLRRGGATGTAREHLERAVSLQPGHAPARNNLAMLLWEDLGDLATAGQHFEVLRRIAPDWPEARMNDGLFRLAQGDFAAGWREYEWRWRSSTYPERDWSLGKPRWDGRPLKGDGLLLWGEQGAGDQILYGTMLADAQQVSGARLFVAVERRLLEPFRRSLAHRDITVVPRGAPVDAVTQCPFGSLGAFLRPSAESFAACDGRFLSAEPMRLQQIRQDLQARAGAGRRLVGLSWRSGNQQIGAAKSIPLADLLPVLRRSDVAWIDLQYGDTAVERAWLQAQGVPLLQDPAIESLQDLDGFAAQVAALDGVLSVSNTTVHVAGALGVPTALLLPRGRGRLWYWPDFGSASRWYGSVRILRQDAPGDWRAAVAQVPDFLSSLKTGELSPAQRPDG